MDIVVLAFVAIIAGTVFFTMIAVALAEVFSPTYDSSNAISQVSELVKTMTTGLLGILAGRGDAYQKQMEGKKNGNGGTA